MARPAPRATGECRANPAYMASAPRRTSVELRCHSAEKVASKGCVPCGLKSLQENRRPDRIARKNMYFLEDRQIPIRYSFEEEPPIARPIGRRITRVLGDELDERLGGTIAVWQQIRAAVEHRQRVLPRPCVVEVVGVPP